MIVLAIGEILLFLVALILLGAILELFREFEHIRERAGLVDESMPLSIPDVVGARPTSVGLQRELDDLEDGLVLILSDKCASCRAIAQDITGSVPDNVYILIEPASREQPKTGLNQLYRFPQERTVVDIGSDIAGRLGIDTTPVGISIRRGRIQGAMTLPSSRRLREVLDAQARTTQVI